MRYNAQKIDLFGDISKKDISHRYIFRSDSFFPFISYNRKDISFSWKDTSSGKKDIFFAPEDISPSAISSSKIKFAPPTYLKFSRRERFKFTFKTFFLQRIPNKSAFQHLSCLYLKRPFVTNTLYFSRKQHQREIQSAPFYGVSRNLLWNLTRLTQLKLKFLALIFLFLLFIF